MSTRKPDPMCPGQYLTDGTRLLRIVTALGRPPNGGLIELEDCRSLEVMLVRAEDLGQLRRVRATREPIGMAVMA